MKTMSVVTKGTTQQDKVKLLSWKELGLNYNSDYFDNSDGGTIYPCFTADDALSTVAGRWRATGSYGNAERYWTRSRRSNTSQGQFVWTVKSNNVCDNDAPSNTRGVLPVMRF